MKQLNTKDWTTIEDMGGLILFVQLMEELLFHFNTHSNKVHATNVRTLVFEANNILIKIDVEKVKSSNILPVIEEIKKNIQSDSVARELLGIKEDYLIKGLNSTENFSEISASIDGMMRHLGNGRYLNEAKKQLLEVIGDPKKKKLIAKLTRLLVSELLNLGYDKQYLYFYLKELFITPKNKVNPTENINKYFELFDGNRKKFKVCRLVNKDYLLFNEIASLLDFKLKRKEELSEDISEKEKKFFSYIRNNEVIFESQYLALDPYHATHLCNSHLKTISNVNSFYSHHKQLKWNQFSLVYNNSGYVNVIEPPVNLMSTRPNKKAEEVIKYAILTLSGRGLARESLVRLRKVMALHGDAMKTDSRQSQLLNLWSALETLFPVPKNESSRINYLVNCLTPILKKVYITNIFFELFIDIKRIIPDLKLDDIEGDSDIEKFIALVCLDDYSNERKARLYDMFSTNNPLATNRIYEMKKNYSDVRNILKLIENHEQKVQWQLKRIYRCRNEIVHSGDYKLPFFSLLIENLHYYVDSIIEYVQKVIFSGIEIKNFEAVVYDCNIDNDYHKNTLINAATQAVNKDNYKSLILGYKI